MMQNSRNTYIQIKQNIFALKALSYIPQLQGIVSIQLQGSLYLLTDKEILIYSNNIYLFTKSIIIRGN